MRWTKRSLSYTFVVTCALGAIVGVLTLLDAKPRDSEAAMAGIVPIELVLLVDTSGSVDEFEYELQKEGYAKAFRNDELISLIEGQGGIAVAYIEWSSVNRQNIRIGWRYLMTPADCIAFSGAIDSIDRLDSNGGTKMAAALEFAAGQLRTNGYSGLKRVIDVSGDGICDNWTYYRDNDEYADNQGRPWDEVIVAISGDVDVVNGICITTSDGVVAFYRDVLPQGDDAFTLQVDDFAAFEEAILTKLRREIAVVPGLYD